MFHLFDCQQFVLFIRTVEFYRWKIFIICCYICFAKFCHLGGALAFTALMLFVRRQEGHAACKKTEWWGAGVVICLECDADLHTAQLMPLPLTVSCFSKIQIGYTFLVPAHPGSPGQWAVKRVCVYVCVCVRTYLLARY